MSYFGEPSFKRAKKSSGLAAPARFQDSVFVQPRKQQFQSQRSQIDPASSFGFFSETIPTPAPQAKISSSLAVLSLDTQEEVPSLKTYVDQDATILLPLGDEVDEFARALLEFQSDQFALLERYAAICSARKQALESPENVVDYQEMKMWEGEEKTWILLANLYRIRTVEFSGKPVIKPRMSDNAILDACIAQDTILQEEIIVKKWLEATADQAQPIEVQARYWEATKMEFEKLSKAGKTPSNIGIVTEFDPDAPTRLGKPLVQSDKEYEHALLRSLFDYLRRGNISGAIDLCRKCDQSWRAATFWGIFRWKDSVLDETSALQSHFGNKNRAAWKAACLAASNASNEKGESFLDKYETAIYALLAGNANNVLPVCVTWEDALWAYYSELVEAHSDQHLREHQRKHPQSTREETAAPLLTAAEIFGLLETSPSSTVSRSAKERFHVIQKRVILNHIDTIIDSTYDVAVNTRSHYQLTRFVVHLLLFLSEIGQLPDGPAIEPGSKNSNLISLYIEELVKCKKSNYVALYTSKLPQEEQIPTYAGLIEHISDPKNVKKHYVSLANEFHLDYSSIAKEAVFNVLAGVKRELQHPRGLDEELFLEIDSNLTESDLQLINCLEWLTLDPNLSTDFEENADLVEKWFFVHRKIAGAEKVQAMRRLDSEKSTANRDLIQAINMFASWAELHARFTPPADTKTTQAYFNLSNETAHALAALLDSEALSTPESGALTLLESDTNLVLRKVYIPNLVALLFQVLYESSDVIDGHLEKSLQLSQLVANEDHRYYLEFSQKQMNQLLQYFRKAHISLLGRNGVINSPSE